MAIYFNTPLLRIDDDRLKLGGRTILRAEERINEAVFMGWRPEFSVMVGELGVPTMMKMERPETALVLRSDYFDCDFERELLIAAPEEQFVNCLSLEKKILMDDGRFCDVAVVMANAGDIFCVASVIGLNFYIVLEDGVELLKQPSYESLERVRAEYLQLFDRNSAEFLLDENFGYSHWREVMPSYW